MKSVCYGDHSVWLYIYTCAEQWRASLDHVVTTCAEQWWASLNWWCRHHMCWVVMSFSWWCCHYLWYKQVIRLVYTRRMVTNKILPDAYWLELQVCKQRCKYQWRWWWIKKRWLPMLSYWVQALDLKDWTVDHHQKNPRLLVKEVKENKLIITRRILVCLVKEVKEDKVRIQGIVTMIPLFEEVGVCGDRGRQLLEERRRFIEVRRRFTILPHMITSTMCTWRSIISLPCSTNPMESCVPAPSLGGGGWSTCPWGLLSVCSLPCATRKLQLGSTQQGSEPQFWQWLSQQMAWSSRARSSSLWTSWRRTKWRCWMKRRLLWRAATLLGLSFLSSIWELFWFDWFGSGAADWDWSFDSIAKWTVKLDGEMEIRRWSVGRLVEDELHCRCALLHTTQQFSCLVVFSIVKPQAEIEQPKARPQSPYDVHFHPPKSWSNHVVATSRRPSDLSKILWFENRVQCL